MTSRLKEPTVGDILLHEFMVPLKLSIEKLAKKAGIKETKLRGILVEGFPVTDYVALKLSKYFGNTQMFWLRLQSNYDKNIKKRLLERGIER